VQNNAPVLGSTYPRTHIRNGIIAEILPIMPENESFNEIDHSEQGN
jgi:hypothetical protein